MHYEKRVVERRLDGVDEANWIQVTLPSYPKPFGHLKSKNFGFEVDSSSDKIDGFQEQKILYTKTRMLFDYR